MVELMRWPVEHGEGLQILNYQVGGETIFPNLSPSIRPRKGSAVYFEYCNVAGQVDPLSLQGGKPVTSAEWILKMHSLMHNCILIDSKAP